MSTSGLSTATHVYTASGTYIVTAEATDTAGESATATASVSVQAVVVTVSMTVTPATITTTAPAEFTATATTTPAGATIERYEWNFGDGIGPDDVRQSTSHLYPFGGGRRYVVSVRAVTITGASGTAQREIVVQ